MRARPLCLLVLLALALPALPAARVAADPGDDATVVIAHIDSGVNPYNVAFRDHGERAFAYPGEYIPGFPAHVPALHLCLDAALHPDCATYAGAVRHDAAIWGDPANGVKSSIVPGQLYWIPGTRIVGAMCWPTSDGANCIGGGASCPLTQVALLNAVNDPTKDCPDHPILDDHGHGTMTASRMGGAGTSLCPTCRLVSIEGLTPDAVLWAAKQGWLDVQTNSWVDLTPPVVSGATQVLGDADPTGTVRGVLGNSTSVEVAEAAQLMPVFFASGNGAAYLAGVAPTPTYLLSTGVPGVILVGGHDNGDITAWAGAPPHVVADAYGGIAAIRTSIRDVRPDPIACCTSAASPYAAGGGAELIRQARILLHDDDSTGVHGGVLARAHGNVLLPASGPLADGVFTLDEFKTLLFHTAQARPQAGPHDGLLDYVATPGSVPVDLIATYGPGANPFCIGCFTLPVPWSQVPDAVEQYPLIGYGSIDPASVAQATAVLKGHAPMPDRAQDDQLYALDQQVREVEFSVP